MDETYWFDYDLKNYKKQAENVPACERLHTITPEQWKQSDTCSKQLPEPFDTHGSNEDKLNWRQASLYWSLCTAPVMNAEEESLRHAGSDRASCLFIYDKSAALCNKNKPDNRKSSYTDIKELFDMLLSGKEYLCADEEYDCHRYDIYLIIKCVVMLDENIGNDKLTDFLKPVEMWIDNSGRLVISVQGCSHRGFRNCIIANIGY